MATKKRMGRPRKAVSELMKSEGLTRDEAEERVDRELAVSNATAESAVPEKLEAGEKPRPKSRKGRRASAAAETSPLEPAGRIDSPAAAAPQREASWPPRLGVPEIVLVESGGRFWEMTAQDWFNAASVAAAGKPIPLKGDGMERPDYLRPYHPGGGRTAYLTPHSLMRVFSIDEWTPESYEHVLSVWRRFYSGQINTSAQKRRRSA